MVDIGYSIKIKDLYRCNALRSLSLERPLIDALKKLHHENNNCIISEGYLSGAKPGSIPKNDLRSQLEMIFERHLDRLAWDQRLKIPLPGRYDGYKENFSE